MTDPRPECTSAVRHRHHDGARPELRGGKPTGDPRRGRWGRQWYRFLERIGREPVFLPLRLTFLLPPVVRKSVVAAKPLEEGELTPLAPMPNPSPSLPNPPAPCAGGAVEQVVLQLDRGVAFRAACQLRDDAVKHVSRAEGEEQRHCSGFYM